MKKILTLFAVVGLTVFSSCSNDDKVDNDTIPYVFEVDNVNFSATSNSDNYVDFDSRIYSGDVVLVYRLTEIDPTTGRDVWTILPDSHYYTDGRLYFSYKFDFTQDDVRIYTEGFDLSNNPIPANLRNNQIFRIVIVAGDDGVNTTSKVKPDYSDYNAVIAKYGIDDSKVKELKVK
jgi:hypothetical protein